MPRCGRGRLKDYGDLRVYIAQQRAIKPFRGKADVAAMQRWSDGEVGFFDDAAEPKGRCCSVRRNRPLSGQADEERTLGVNDWGSCCGSTLGWRTDGFATGEGFDDDHRRAAVWANEGRLNAIYAVRQLRFGCVGDEVQQRTRLGE